MASSEIGMGYDGVRQAVYLVALIHTSTHYQIRLATRIQKGCHLMAVMAAVMAAVMVVAVVTEEQTYPAAWKMSAKPYART